MLCDNYLPNEELSFNLRVIKLIENHEIYFRRDKKCKNTSTLVDFLLSPVTVDPKQT